MVRRFHYLFVALQVTTLVLLACSAAPAQTGGPLSSGISFTVTMPRPYTHLLEVEMRVQIPANLQVANETDLVMPVWTPGSYLIREFERHVQDFAADANGRALDWATVNKNTWRVKTGGARQWRATYRVYANELSVRTSELNSDHAFWNNAALLMYRDGSINSPATLRILPAPGWKIATGLPAVDGQPNTFRAENFDVLYDSPVECSNFKPTALGFSRNGFAKEEGYRSFLYLVAHEFFHLWNVKRIKPDALGPFDYTKENYTRLLWVAEGVTDYYGQIMPRRAGLISDQTYLDQLAKRIQSFEETPGRFEMSAEEASFNAWIKEYRPDENSINSSISYYSKGELLGLLLDLDIRRRTHGAKSLDDVMRYLYNEFYNKSRNYTPADVQKACELMAGASLDQFFARYVRGRDEFQYNEILTGAGLQLEQGGIPIGGSGPDTPVRIKAFLGADLEQTGDRLLITHVRAGTPAYDQGLNANDQIVALEGARVTKETFDARIAEKKPGDAARVTVFRFDDLRTFEIRLGSQVDAPFRIVPIAQASDEQKRIYQAWLGAH